MIVGKHKASENGLVALHDTLEFDCQYGYEARPYFQPKKLTCVARYDEKDQSNFGFLNVEEACQKGTCCLYS
jgi:hypothetical protein